MSTHEFALYCKHFLPLARLQVGAHVSISDVAAIHRVKHVLRLIVGEKLIFFDEHYHVRGTIGALHEKSIEFVVESRANNVEYKPTLIVQVPLLKREALQEAVESLACLGVTAIKLFTSNRVQRAWGGVHEYDRLYRCMIAAAEQSKNFFLPVLHEPVHLEQLVLQIGQTCALACCVDGAVFSQVLLDSKKKNSITILIGPEGDFTEQETTLIARAGYRWCRLVPTILRSEQAAALAAGIVRSCDFA